MSIAAHDRAEGLRLEAVEIVLAGRRLVSLDASVRPGETFAIMGPSGSGKSSLLAYLGGFLAPAFEARGRILLGGRDLSAVPAARRNVGLLFQDALLFPHMDVAGNLLFALPAALRGREPRRAAASAMLARVGLAGFERRDPATLSGGQQARVALARTLLAEPAALLLDEPFSCLDLALRAEIRALVFGLVAERAIPALLVTHDPADVAAAGGGVLRIGEGGPA